MDVLEIKAILFDGEHRNSEIQMPQIMISPLLGQKFYYSEDALTVESGQGDDPRLRAVQNDETADIFKPRNKIIRTIRVENVTVDIFERENLYIKDRDFMKLNLTLSDCSASQTGISFEEYSHDQCLMLTLENEEISGQDATKFPRKITLMLNPEPLDVYMERIANYSFAATMCIMISFFVMLGQIK